MSTSWEFPKNPIPLRRETNKNGFLTSVPKICVSEDYSDTDCEGDNHVLREDITSATGNVEFNNKQKVNTQHRRPTVVTMKNPENNFIKKKYENDRKSEKPLILLAGDSTIRNVTSFDLKKDCQEAKVMVRPYRGGKIKNIKKLVLDVLDDGIKPTAICIHASTHDIGNENVYNIDKGKKNNTNYVSSYITSRQIFPSYQYS